MSCETVTCTELRATARVWGVGFTLLGSFTLLQMWHVCWSTSPFRALYNLSFFTCIWHCIAAFLSLLYDQSLYREWSQGLWITRWFLFTRKHLAMHKSLNRYERLSFFCWYLIISYVLNLFITHWSKNITPTSHFF